MGQKLRRRDFSLLKTKAHRVKGRFFIFLFNRSLVPAAGFIVSRRHGGAVARNLQKRWIREFLREQRGSREALLHVKLLIVALPHKGLYHQKQEDFLKCLEKMKNLLPAC